MAEPKGLNHLDIECEYTTYIGHGKTFLHQHA